MGNSVSGSPGLHLNMEKVIRDLAPCTRPALPIVHLGKLAPNTTFLYLKRLTLLDHSTYNTAPAITLVKCGDGGGPIPAASSENVELIRCEKTQ
jgi:hypothetical protein